MEQYIFKETEWYSLTSKILDITKLNAIFYGKSVALIGNSQDLLNQKFGSVIDSHDVVCRINRGIENIITNPDAVGKRIDVLFYSMCRSDIVPFKLKKEVTCIQTTQKYSDSRLDNDTFFYKDMLLLNSKLNLSKKQIPSTGITAIDIITQAKPKSLNIYGFDFKKSPTYYHNTDWYQKSHPVTKIKHDWEKEKNFVNQLMSESTVEIHYE
jgi:hypothetical protein